MKDDVLIDAVSNVDDDLLLEAMEYTREKKNYTVPLAFMAVAASAAILIVTETLFHHDSSSDNFEVNNPVQIQESAIVTGITSNTANNIIPAVSNVTEPVTENFSKETSTSVSSSETDISHEDPENDVKPVTSVPSIIYTNDHNESEDPVPPAEITGIPETDPPVSSVLSESEVNPPSPPNPDPSSGTVITEIGPPPVPEIILPVNSENNHYDNATLSGIAYSKRGAYIFNQDQIDKRSVLAFIIEDIATSSGTVAAVNTLTEFSSEDLFLLKCGTTEGKYYIFVNDSLSEEYIREIFSKLGISENSAEDQITVTGSENK